MIFDKQVSRKPNHYPWMKDFILAMRKNPWDSERFTFASDYHDYYHRFDDQLRLMTDRTLGAIAQIEIAVKTYWGYLGDNLPHPIFRDAGYTMANVEVIHNDAYERLLEVLGKEHIQEEVLENEVMKNRMAYLSKYNEKNYADDKKQYTYSLILFTLFTENVSLFSQFYVLNWINRAHNCLIDTTQQTNYTVREELLHGMTGTAIVNQIREEHPEIFDSELDERVMSRAWDAFNAECAIVDWILGDFEGVGPLGEKLDAETLKEFVLLRINTSLQGVGYPGLIPTNDEKLKGSQWFSEEIVSPVLTDFFHRRPTDYAHNTHSFTPETVLPQIFAK